MATPKPITDGAAVADAHLLDGDDDEVEVLTTEEDYNILNNDATPSRRGPQTPPEPRQSKTPPPALDNSSVVKEKPKKLFFANGKHITKLHVYMHTKERRALQKVIESEFPCHPDFFNQRRTLENIIDRARTLLLQQEPYHTLLTEGYNFEIDEAQISYKVLALDENILLDFVVDLAQMNYSKANDFYPLPFFETTNDVRFSQTDISFRFTIPTLVALAKPKMTDRYTMTFDAALVNPIVDHIRSSAKTWSVVASQLDTPEQTKPTQTLPTLTLAGSAAAPPRHHFPQGSESSSRPALVNRLGPPVPHAFRSRSRSRERSGPRSRGRSRDSKDRRSRHGK